MWSVVDDVAQGTLTTAQTFTNLQRFYIFFSGKFNVGLSLLFPPSKTPTVMAKKEL